MFKLIKKGSVRKKISGNLVETRNDSPRQEVERRGAVEVKIGL